MKIAALFTDYDGTLAPADVRREESAVPGPLSKALSEISSQIPVAVITSKDLGFVKPRTPFAWAWATALGLEVRLRDGSGYQTQVQGNLRRSLDRVTKTLPTGLVVEEKRGTDGSLLGVSLDWTTISGPPPLELEEAETTFRTEGFQVRHYAGVRYVDVYAAPTDKGSAVRALVDLLGVKGPVMYLGDTEADNEAFEASDVGVCVEHSQRTDLLDCEFAVRDRELPRMLAALSAGGFEFGQDMIGAVKETNRA